MLDIEKIKNTIICGDCLKVMKEIPDKSIDLVLTDPPYGVNFQYDQYQDTPENLKELVNKFMPEILRISKRALITCGNSNWSIYPKPNWVLAWVTPAGAGMNPWGFTCWQPILAYGKDPYLENRLGSRPDVFIHTETAEKWIEHSCNKPIEFWKKLLLRGSVKETDIIYDPFMGSGTTAVACQSLNRKFIGSEISEKYCEIAKQRLRQQVLL
jgi:site-specific DNA-methyltransferase (adenine-specific)